MNGQPACGLASLAGAMEQAQHRNRPAQDAAPRPATAAASFRFGMLEAAGAPAIIMGASFVGFGSLVRESGLSLAFGLVSSATGWGASV